MAVDVDAGSRVATAAVASLKVLADPLRWRILELLSVEELCVCHLVDELGVGQPLVSHHLRALRHAGLVTTSKHRYWTYYRIQPEALVGLADAIAGLARQVTAPGLPRRPCC